VCAKTLSGPHRPDIEVSDLIGGFHTIAALPPELCGSPRFMSGIFRH
jgi:hypothetical protein